MQTEYDDISMITKIFLTRFGGIFGTLTFDEEPFFKTLLGFTPNWDNKHRDASHAAHLGFAIVKKFQI